MPRRKAIIAVFGSADAEGIALARKLGAAIAASENIVLTGGTGAGGSAVKESAIEGANGSPWVGVDPKGVKKGIVEAGRGLIVRTDLGDRRNFLEACLCDAAFGIVGGDGTTSEVTFSLALHRPVVLLGNWAPLDVANREATLNSRVKSSFARMGSDVALGGLLDRTKVCEQLRTLPPYAYRQVADKPSDLVDWVSRQLGEPLPGTFPEINGYADVRAAYNAWLRKHAY